MSINTMRKLIQILSTGYILMYFSEHLFWARFRPGDSLSEFLATWLAYSFLAYILLILLWSFRINDRWSLFLAGAVVGWLAEGVIVHTMYDDFPLNLSFTGLAWHSLISVCAGWAGLNLLLRSRSRGGLFVGAIALGWFWFFWGVSWMYEEPATAATPLAFAGYIIPTTALLALALFASRQTLMRPIPFHRWECVLLALAFGGLFLLGAVPQAGWLALSAPVLIGLAIAALWRSSRRPASATLLEKLEIPFPISRLATLLLVPLTAVPLYAVVHTLVYRFDLHLPTHWLVYAITTPAGFILLLISLTRKFKEPAHMDTPPVGDVN